jgi:L-ascorbate metabolism protein UlaG (beta-lactamase superfamily)
MTRKPCHGGAKPPARERLRGAAAVARSGARRYPGELAASVRTPADSHPVAPLTLESAASRSPLAAAWLGHATVLLRLGDQWILTDPVFSHRIGIRLGRMVMGVSRVMPAFDLAALPPIDLVLISHAHFDHLDKPTLRRIVSPETRVITAKNTRRLIPRGFGEVRELHWDESVDLGPLTVSALRPQHWGARTAWDRHRGFNSYVLESRSTQRRRVLYAGDTAHTDAFAAVGGADLSIFGIGAYDPWIANHASPEQVWAMHRQAGGAYLLPMHHSTFRLSDEPMDEPLRRLLAAAGEEADRVVAREPGRLWVPPRLGARG